MSKSDHPLPFTQLQQKIEELTALVNSTLEKVLPAETDYPALIHQSMRYSIFAGGKRIRPVLCLLTFEMLNGTDHEAAQIAACALEMIHTYSLIHDDLPAMDNDDLRRGKPTNHKKFDEATAILAGDALQTYAFEILSYKLKDTSIALQAIQCLSRAIGTKGMIGGQILDIQGEKIEKPTLAEVEAIHQRKTGALLQASMEMGAIIAKTSPAVMHNISKIGSLLGMAFQITDDILDLESSAEVLGKTVHKDLKVNKITYPRIIGIKESRSKAQEIAQEAIGLLENFRESSQYLQTLASYIIDRKK